jgi:Family of unknown function (DUF6105)
MRYFLILWVAPLVLFWGWFGLSAYDLNFGSVYLSRELHDIVMAVYAKTLGIEADAIPQLFASASITDSVLVGAIIAYRWRARWWPRLRGFVEAQIARHRPDYGQSPTPTSAPSDPMRPGG